MNTDRSFKDSASNTSRRDAIDALASMPPEEVAKEIQAHAVANWAKNQESVESRENAILHAKAYEDILHDEEEVRERWRKYRAEAPLTETRADSAIELNRKNLPEVTLVGFYGIVWVTLGGAEITNATTLIYNSGSAFADNLMTSISLAVSLIGGAFIWAHVMYARANAVLRQTIIKGLQRYGLGAILLGFVLFGILFGGSHAPVNATSGTGVPQGGLGFKLFTALSLLFLLVGLFSTELAITDVIKRLRPTIEVVGQAYQLGDKQVRCCNQRILRTAKAKGAKLAVVRFHDQTIQSKTLNPKLEVINRQQAKNEERERDQRAFDAGVAELRRKYFDSNDN